MISPKDNGACSVDTDHQRAPSLQWVFKPSHPVSLIIKDPQKRRTSASVTILCVSPKKSHPASAGKGVCSLCVSPFAAILQQSSFCMCRGQ